MAQTLSNLPIGATVKFGKHQIDSETAQPIIWVVADKNHSGYPANSVTLVAQKIIDVRPYDATETDFSKGNRDYSLSNIHQWLNSSGEAGKWYSPTHSTDAEPRYQARPGFLYNFTETERNTILPTTLTVQTNDQGLKPLTTNIFLLSSREVLGSSDTDDGSTRLAYFESNPVTAVFTQQAYDYAYTHPVGITSKFKYLTRSTKNGYIISIKADGGTDLVEPYDSAVGLRPGLNLPATAKITSTPDSDGCYTFIVNKAPTITGTNSDLGNKTSGFSYTYTVADGDSEPVTVTEHIDNVLIRSYVASLNTAANASVTGNTWLKLANGKHTLKITATDGFDTVTRVVTFTRVINKMVVQRTTPISASTMPTRIIVTLVKNVPYNAKVKVEVCNNGFDTAPVWEEFSTYDAGLAHTFSNKTKTAGQWGVNIRVTVDRNGGEGACYISEIGGNFE